VDPLSLRLAGAVELRSYMRRAFSILYSLGFVCMAHSTQICSLICVEPQTDVPPYVIGSRLNDLT